MEKHDLAESLVQTDLEGFLEAEKTDFEETQYNLDDEEAR